MITKKEALAYFFLCAAPGMHRVFLKKRGWWAPITLIIAAFASLLKGFHAGFAIGLSAFAVLVIFDAVMIHRWVGKDEK